MMMQRALTLIAIGVVSADGPADHFGPSGCASVSLSSEGTCVVSTDCQQHDTSKLEFAFDCRLPDGGLVERHSFGLGGFDANEEFDTEVKCAACSSPGHMSPLIATVGVALSKVGKAMPSAPFSQHAIKLSAEHLMPPSNNSIGTDTTLSPSTNLPNNESSPSNATSSITSTTSPSTSSAQTLPADTAWATPTGKGNGPPSDFGPDKCVSTWRSSDGHCIMQTRCNNVNIDDYEFGLVCVDSDGRPVRHIFGKGSFDHEETFDTLIPCPQCLGLKNLPDEVLLKNEVIGVVAEVKAMRGMLNNIVGNITMLNAKVFANDPPVVYSPAPPPMPVVAASPISGLVSSSSSFVHQHLRGTRRQHHVQRDEQRMEDDNQEEPMPDAHSTQVDFVNRDAQDLDVDRAEQDAQQQLQFGEASADENF